MEEDGCLNVPKIMDHFGLTTGYMLSLNINKKKETGVKQVHIGDRLLYEWIV